MTLKYKSLRNSRLKEKELLSLELTEIKDIADIIFKRINRKIEILEAIENSVDEKIRTLEKLIQKAEAAQSSLSKLDRHGEITLMGRKGMSSREIAEALDVPVGEVDLILNLKGINTGVKTSSEKTRQENFSTQVIFT
ncbi:MAG: hypothetical protein HXY52_00670 [Nitrospirae bacterium]|nr:hypothetical protein [Nitrospirota bacterium]